MCLFLDINELECQWLDTFVRDLLNLSFGRKTDKSLANIQSRICDVFGPLTAAWPAVENDGPVKEVIQLVQVAITPMGNTSNVSIMRRQTGICPVSAPQVD